MATKNNPGAFDCYAKAEPDEPMFVLLGRDRHAPTLVALWALLREIDGERRDVIDEAREASRQMALFATARGKTICPKSEALMVMVISALGDAHDVTAWLEKMLAAINADKES